MASKMFSFGIFCLISITAALQVTPNSPCSSFCVDSNDLNFGDPNSSNTKNKDIVCYDDDYQSTPAGQKFQRCLSCLQDSTYSKGAESDQLWFLYNLRYTVDYCIFGFPNATNVASTPCSTERACGQLQGALTGDLIASAKKPDYAFCDANGAVMLSEETRKCYACVSASEGQDYLGNFVTALEAGCRQKPSQGVAIGLNDTVFTIHAIEGIDPATASTTEHKTFTTPVLVGIGIGGAVALAIFAGLIFVCCKKRRNRRIRLNGGRSGRVSSGEYPISPLSFRCQTHTTPRDSVFFKNPAEVSEEFKKSASPIEFTHRNLTPTLESAAVQMPNYGGWQPQLPKSRNASLTGEKGNISLENIDTMTNNGPTVPGNVHYAWSPQTLRQGFSPVDSIVSPQSTTSTKSTTALLPLKPYNPAEYGSSSHGKETGGGVQTSSTPISGTTASPIISQGWNNTSPQQKHPSHQDQGWGELPPRSLLPLRKDSNNVTYEKASLAVTVARTTTPKRRSGNGASPVESSTINTVFPGPPPRRR